MAVKWTKEQQQVIDLRNRNILVSAAAGSGKTAVLVERIITMLTKDKDPRNVDELLIVTFTEAAAAEMKERVLAAIEKELEKNPENVHLQKQETLIHNAMITTIHSFCLSVIKENFHVIDLDPAFRIGEEGELKLLKQDVMEEMMEEEFEKSDPEFIRFVEQFATGRDDKKLEDIILQIYEFSRSYPDPEQWLSSCVDLYCIEGEKDLENSVAIGNIKDSVRRYAKDAIALLQQALDVCQEESGPYMYAETIEQEMEGWKALQEADSFGEMDHCSRLLKAGRLKANKDKSVDEEKAEFVKEARKEVKATGEKLIKDYFYTTTEEMWKDIAFSKKVVEEIMFLVKEYSQRFSEKKRSKNMIDFGDMEHFALQILKDENVASEYKKRFKEVMVDEYQDSNYIQEAILTSVSTVKEGNYNMFMVGDVKQSIYRFRLSRPELFMEKFNTYSLKESKKQRIDLHKNFRSRKEVLDSTNFIFSQIMTKSLGGIEYDDQAALHYGADYEETEGNDAEILIVDLDLESEDETKIEETSKELEARAIARRMKQLMEEKEILDKETKQYRKVKYKDMVILTRSLKGWTDEFAKILNREGIPTYTGTKEGYFETQEIRTILDYLRVLDNPRQDIPMASVLTSKIVGLKGEELAKIRGREKELPFYECVKEYAGSGEDLVLRKKIEKCLEKMEYFREMIPYTAIHELLWKILEETGYLYEVAVMPGGEQRAANVQMLLEKAKVFEGTSYKGLFNFVRYIEQLKKYDVDYGEANVLDEQMDAVRLMSIHKSKGLEFPIVFVAGMNKRFNQQDVRGEIVLHPTLGLGVDAVDLTKRTKTPTILKKASQREVFFENMGEELRILYVALTRAKEKLILTGTMSNIENKIKSYAKIKDRKEVSLPFSVLTGAGTYFDWILPCFVRNKSMKEIFEQFEISSPFSNPLYEKEVPVSIKIMNLEELVKEEMEEEMESELSRDILLNWDCEEEYSPLFSEKLKEQFSYIYPFEDQQTMKLKFTVSELKKRQSLKEESGELLYQDQETAPVILKKLEEEQTLKGAARGSAYHKVMELLDFSKDYDDHILKEEIRHFYEQGKLSEEMYRSIYRKDIMAFLNTDIAKRMKNAARKECLFKEQPFVLGVDAEEIYPEIDSDETLLIQGIIDAWFFEEDKIVVLDYKTDYVTEEQELKNRYKDQLEYYGRALGQLTGKKVKEKKIYSFKLKKEIDI